MVTLYLVILAKIHEKCQIQKYWHKKRAFPSGKTLYQIFSANLCFSWDYRNIASVKTAPLEYYGTIYQCIQSVVTTHTYVSRRIVNCTSLTNDDIACLASLTTKNLNA